MASGSSAVAGMKAPSTWRADWRRICSPDSIPPSPSSWASLCCRPSSLSPPCRRGSRHPFLLQSVVIGSGFRLQSRRYGGGALLLSLLYPVAVLVLLGAAWNSALRTIARGGIRWRDTFYPLSELRAGRVRAGAGRRFEVL